MPPKKKPVSKKKATQKQKQRQSQRVVVNIGTAPRKRRRRVKPRATTQANTSRELGQFYPLPPYGFPAPPQPNASATNTILPTSNIVPFSQPQSVSASTTNNAFAPTPPSVQTTGRVLGRSNSAPPPLAPTTGGVPSLGRFFTNLPLGEPPAQPPSLRRAGSSQLQRSIPDILEYEKIADATKRAEQENPEIFAATEPPVSRPAPPPPPMDLDFRTKEGAAKRDLADAFRGKSLGRSGFDLLRANVEGVRAERERERQEARTMAREMMKEDTTLYAGGGGGGMGGRKGAERRRGGVGGAIGGTPMGAPAPLASKARIYGEAAEEDGY